MKLTSIRFKGQKIVTVKYLLLACFLVIAACTTQRPLYLDAPAGKKDTLVMSSVVYNETKVKDSIRIIHDTLVVRETIKVSTPAELDTAAIRMLLAEHFGATDVTLEQMHSVLLAMQVELSKTKRGSDSQRVVLQQKLDTTNKEKILAQKEIAATRVILYDAPVYMGIALIILLLLLQLLYVLIRRRYLKKKRLKEKQLEQSGI